MEELDAAEQKFLRGTWNYFKLHDLDMPTDIAPYGTLMNFIGCLNNFSSDCSISIIPRGLQHLLCAELQIELKLEALETRKKASKRKKGKPKIDKPVKSKHKRKSSKEEEDEETSDEDDNEVDNESIIPKLAKKYSLKICLDPYMELLFSSRRLPKWMQERLCRCLGVKGNMELMATVRGDPRHIVQLVGQKKCIAKDTEASATASMENEWVEAMKRRCRYYGNTPVLGAVTEKLGNMPEYFPTVQDITATYRKVPLSSLPRPVCDVDEVRLQECRQSLADLRVDNIKVHLSSPSLLHLYYNNSLDAYQAKETQKRSFRAATNDAAASGGVDDTTPGEGVMETVPPTMPSRRSDDEWEDMDAGTGTQATKSKKKKKKTKLNLEGVITDVPFFIERLRSKATFRPVLEYK